MQSKTVRVANYGLMIALAFTFSWLEHQCFPIMPVPGMKLGLTNLVVLIVLYKMSAKDAFWINVVRILLVAATFGNMSSLMYSLAGGMLSTIVMILLKKGTKASVLIVSLMGAISHNVGQILVSMILLETTKMVYYLPFLWISGTVSGVCIGILGAMVIKKLPRLGNYET